MVDVTPCAMPVRETAALLDAVDAASRNSSGAQCCVLLRLTDGRVKVVQAVGADPRLLLERLTRRHGPLSAAYYVEPRTPMHRGTRVRDLIGNRSWQLGHDGWTAETPANQPRAAGLSRNAAIFAASLGMSTGALPKVEAIFTSPGAFS